MPFGQIRREEGGCVSMSMYADGYEWMKVDVWRVHSGAYVVRKRFEPGEASGYEWFSRVPSAQLSIMPHACHSSLALVSSSSRGAFTRTPTDVSSGRAQPHQFLASRLRFPNSLNHLRCLRECSPFRVHDAEKSIRWRVTLPLHTGADAPKYRAKYLNALRANMPGGRWIFEFFGELSHCGYGYIKWLLWGQRYVKFLRYASFSGRFFPENLWRWERESR